MTVTKKMTEKQLSKIFQQTRKVDDDASLDILENYSQASETRLHASEAIADNNLLSASQQVLNKLSAWTQVTAKDIKNLNNTNSKFDLFSWFKPGLVAMAFITTFLFLNPEINDEATHQQITDKIMFDSSFESTNSNPDIIINSSFDSGLNNNQDIISNVSFG